MNKTILFIVGGVVIVGVITAAILLKPKNISNPQNVINVAENEETIEDGKTLRDYLFGGAGSAGLKCVHSSSIGKGNTLTVTTYIAGEKLATNYEMIPPLQGQDNLHMVAKDGYGYVWGDSYLGNKMNGFKIDLSEDGAEDSEQMQETVDLDMELFGCEPWTPNNDVFDLPAELSFVTMEEYMDEQLNGFNLDGFDMDESMDADADDSDEETDSQNGALLNDPCASCEQLPGDEAEQCFEMLGCN